MRRRRSFGARLLNRCTMKTRWAPRIFAAGFVLFGASLASAQDSFTAVAEQVNRKMVKVFGAGGFKGLPSYGTGILVSPKGHVLTVNNHILTTQDLRVRLYDGRIFHHCKVIAREPELDVALLKIDDKSVGKLPYFNMSEAA